MSGEPPSDGPPKKPGGRSGNKSRRRRRKRADAKPSETADRPRRRSGSRGPTDGAPHKSSSNAAGEPPAGKPQPRRPRRPQPPDDAPGDPNTQRKAAGSGGRRRRKRRRRPERDPQEPAQSRQAGRPPRAGGHVQAERGDPTRARHGGPDDTRRIRPAAAQARDPGLSRPKEWGPPGAGPAPLRPDLPEILEADDLALELDPELNLDLDPDPKQELPPPQAELQNVAMVRLRDHASVQAYGTGDITLDGDERVVVETEQGHAVGSVARRSQRTLIKQPLPSVLRRIDSNDMRQEARNAIREREAYAFCRERIAARSLPMKLIRVEYLHGGNKAMFYFAAEHRVDFRDLVKDLAQRFHTRIVMRQVGVRDEAKMTGGIGSCGMPLCCASWLPRFDPVSIRMAKDQNLVLNPQKVSGQCGRLKCCLSYEQALYHEARRDLPKAGRTVRTPDGEGRVQDLDILRRQVRVSLPDGKVQIYDASQIEQIPRKPPGK